MLLDFSKIKSLVKRYLKKYYNDDRTKFTLTEKDIDYYYNNKLLYEMLLPYMRFVNDELELEMIQDMFKKKSLNVSNVKNKYLIGEKIGKKLKKCDKNLIDENAISSGMFGRVYKVSPKVAAKVQIINIKSKMIGHMQLDNEKEEQRLINLLKNEYENSQKIGKTGLGPKIYNFKICKLDTVKYAFIIYMELIDGTTIDNYLFDQEHKNKKDFIEKVKKVEVKIKKALDKLHQLNILHNDFHHGNMMITNKGQIKIIDFGLSKNLTDQFDRDLTDEKNRFIYMFKSFKDTNKPSIQNHLEYLYMENLLKYIYTFIKVSKKIDIKI